MAPNSTGSGPGCSADVPTTGDYGAYISMSGRGEPVPLESNYCEIDPNAVDKYGISTLRFHYKWSDYEVKQAKHIQDAYEEIILAMGGTPLGNKPGPKTTHGYVIKPLNRNKKFTSLLLSTDTIYSLDGICAEYKNA